jgi:hypothetical protein
MTASASNPSAAQAALRAKIGSGSLTFDAVALKRAEEALAQLSGQFDDWMRDEVAKVEAARDAARADGWSDTALTRLHTAAHDAKGLGATCHFPLVTLLSASLCRLIDTQEGKDAARAHKHLVEAHVEAIRAIVRDGVRDQNHPVGQAILKELTAQVDALGVAPQ